MDIGNISYNDIKNSVIVISLDNLIYLCNQFLELKEINTQQREYYSLLKNISQDILSDMGEDILNIDEHIKRPLWNP